MTLLPSVMGARGPERFTAHSIADILAKEGSSRSRYVEIPHFEISANMGRSRDSRDIEEKVGHQLGAEVHKQSFGGEDGLLRRSDTKVKLSQEHFLIMGGESKQAENKTESIFGCKQPLVASSGGLRLKSGGEMFGGGGERPLGEILRTERQQVGGERLETPLGERMATERMATERLATERLATERLATERLATERMARVAFNEDRLGVKTKLSVEETGVLSR